MTTAPFRIAVFGNRGYASALLTHLLARGEKICAVVTRFDSVTPVMIRVAQRLRAAWWGRALACSDPFDAYDSPATIARAHDIPVLAADTIRMPTCAGTLRACAPDLVFVAGFHRKIPSSVIAVPVRGMVNLHPALLPKHRGGTPNRWVVRLGERETGVTAHLVTAAFDAGDILTRERVTVAADATWGDVEIQVIRAVIATADRVLAAARVGVLRGIPQEEHASTYDPPYHGAHQHIAWTDTGASIRRTCYAIRPKSGGITSCRGHALIVWDGEAVSVARHPVAPGTVLTIDDAGCPVVACGDGAFRIIACVSRGRIIPARRMVRSLRMRPGDRLDT